jgi:hypothetical protein
MRSRSCPSSLMPPNGNAILRRVHRDLTGDWWHVVLLVDAVCVLWHGSVRGAYR